MLHPQAIADHLVSEVLPERHGVYKSTITWTAGGGDPACIVRAQVGPTPYEIRELSGVGPDPSTATVDLYNRVREYFDGAWG